jgi:hypothetical protein
LEHDYEFIHGNLKVKVISFESFAVKAIRGDDGETTYFPVPYFEQNFKEINNVIH